MASRKKMPGEDRKAAWSVPKEMTEVGKYGRPAWMDHRELLPKRPPTKTGRP